MTDITVTPGSVVSGANAIKQQGICGETILQGQSLYKAAATGLWMKADCNSATAEARAGTAIALSGGSVNQPLTVQTEGDITIGGTVVPGTPYCVSNTAGGICPWSALTTGDYVSLLGLGKTTAAISLKPQSVNVAL